ncbi:thioesterase family protein [Tsukamurella sp. 8F]|uniref:acyl-CoA thioesterase n=1 Tax=unclassified Tsukamurella TaxID=2633480 RepID=UPI0023B96AAA|nr:MULTISPECIES: thioesterase family protein [unclassified Tsukamurella]MDF0529664.1 thioesterase family protein [Tsukamurella sp. 8J]MDF0585949.1 thioesterase family protein [Tsukamurella sp. 8F]
MTANLTYTAAGITGRRTERGLVVPVDVRWSDMDAYQHINNARMVTLLEEARIPLLFAPDAPTKPLEAGLLVARIEVDYRGQLRHQDSPLQVTMSTSKVRAADFVVHHEVRAADTDSCSAAAVSAIVRLAAFDVESQRVHRLSPEQREYLKSFECTE